MKGSGRERLRRRGRWIERGKLEGRRQSGGEGEGVGGGEGEGRRELKVEGR